ncbi:fibrinogen-like YCDxxxxGGGW domain-containing protein, partial [uncultured Microbacterium sp.]|uniref:fibrinogen-like YCDxxxxGGGW domain-containing protein n=1 Tax=uncultured Microbacterium sp. TaxID=191216 RepID=UPI0025DAE761
MRYIESERRFVWSASDLKAAAECEFAWVRAIDAKLGRIDPVEDPVDLTLERAGRLGGVHERRTLEAYRERFGGAVVEIPETASSDAEALARAVALTNQALLSADAVVIYQASFADDEFVGFADFLLRDSDGRWIVQDTKLARHARVTALMQLAAYVDRLDQLGVPRADEVQLLLGDGSTSNRNTPVQVRNINDATKITAGAYHTCALRRGGGVKCWGYNPFGGLGDGSRSQRNTAVDVRGISNATQVSAGYYHTCVRLSNSQFKCFGYGWYHNVANTSQRQSYNQNPVTVSNASGVEINATAWGACYRRDNGTVGCFGYGCHGQMGDGRTSCYNYGNRTVSGASNSAELGGGYYHMCSRDSEGAVKCWGYNGYGQIGDGTTTSRSTATAVRTMTDAVTISQSGVGMHSCAARSGGTVSCWGRNSYGQMGTGTSGGNATTPVNVIGAVAGDVGLGNSATNPGRSCKHIKDTRATNNQTARTGTYFLDPNGGANTDSRAVYCDMTTDGGGWTQVANSYDYTFNDQSQGYYSSIAGKVPGGRHYGIWNGMRDYVTGNADVRFTCKLDKNSNSNNVDLSYY